ncbi:MAG: prolyl-tRNA synthetase associated domain-containing protein [Verrucomicrobiota bacterium]|nr:prolyl-tRNA synthetase associated domain-containing protein [Verrucomicrobiota bacterium]
MSSMVTRSAAALACETRIFNVLSQYEIPFKNYPHAPVLTCEQLEKALQASELTAPVAKNLFLKDNKGRYWLIAALEHTKVDLKTVVNTLKAAGYALNNLRFPKEEDLEACLGISRGAVTPFALINDTGKKVFPLIDEGILNNKEICCHPLHNEATTVIASQDLVKFFKNLGREFLLMKKGDLGPTE